MHQKHKNTRI